MKSKQTYLKREKEEKKKKKREEKEEKRLERKNNSDKGKGFDAMIAYVDENGQLSDTPPDPSKRKEVKLEDIQLGARQPGEEDAKEFENEGRISYFNDAQGYGFIKDSRTKESVFFHINAAVTPVKLNDLVSFGKVKGPKGINAADVRKID